MAMNIDSSTATRRLSMDNKNETGEASRTTFGRGTLLVCSPVKRRFSLRSEAMRNDKGYPAKFMLSADQSLDCPGFLRSGYKQGDFGSRETGKDSNNHGVTAVLNPTTKAIDNTTTVNSINAENMSPVSHRNAKSTVKVGQRFKTGIGDRNYMRDHFTAENRTLDELELPIFHEDVSRRPMIHSIIAADIHFHPTDWTAGEIVPETSIKVSDNVTPGISLSPTHARRPTLRSLNSSFSVVRSRTRSPCRSTPRRKSNESNAGMATSFANRNKSSDSLHKQSQTNSSLNDDSTSVSKPYVYEFDDGDAEFGVNSHQQNQEWPSPFDHDLIVDDSTQTKPPSISRTRSKNRLSTYNGSSAAAAAATKLDIGHTRSMRRSNSLQPSRVRRSSSRGLTSGQSSLETPASRNLHRRASMQTDSTWKRNKVSGIHLGVEHGVGDTLEETVTNNNDNSKIDEKEEISQKSPLDCNTHRRSVPRRASSTIDKSATSSGRASTNHSEQRIKKRHSLSPLRKNQTKGLTAETSGRCSSPNTIITRSSRSQRSAASTRSQKSQHSTSNESTTSDSGSMESHGSGMGPNPAVGRQCSSDNKSVEVTARGSSRRSKASLSHSRSGSSGSSVVGGPSHSANSISRGNRRRLLSGTDPDKHEVSTNSRSKVATSSRRRSCSGSAKSNEIGDSDDVKSYINNNRRRSCTGNTGSGDCDAKSVVSSISRIQKRRELSESKSSSLRGGFAISKDCHSILW